MTTEDKNGRRFSDPVLQDFYEEFKEHTRADKQDRKILIESQRKNTEAIGALITQVTELTNNTRDIISIWKAGEGVIRFGSILAKFARWISSLAIIGVIAAWMLKKLGVAL